MVIGVTWLSSLIILNLYTLVVTGIPPSISETCNQDCTLAENLPCKIWTAATDCPMDDHYSSKLWPGPPDNFDIYNVTYEIIESECIARLWIRWTVPNDSSGKTVRGFELRVISLSEPYVNRKLCAVFNLSNAVWTDEDIVSMHPYTYSCALVPPGSYSTYIYSLPRPNYGAVDKRNIIDRFTIPEAFIVNGTCVLPRPSPSLPTRHPTPAENHHQEPLNPAPVEIHHQEPLNTHPVAASDISTQNKPWPEWLGVGIGIVGGLLVLGVVLIITLKRCYKPRLPKQVANGGGSTEQLIDSEDEDDPDPFRTPSPITVDDLLSDRYPPYEARPCDMMAEPHRCDGYLNDRQSFNYYRGFDNPEVMNDRPVEETGCDYCPQHQAEARVHHHPRRPVFKPPVLQDGSVCDSEEAWKVNQRPSYARPQPPMTRNINPSNLPHSQPQPENTAGPGQGQGQPQPENTAGPGQGRRGYRPPQSCDNFSDISSMVGRINQTSGPTYKQRSSNQ